MIPFNKPANTGNEKQYVLEVVQSDKISSDGLFAKKCEKSLLKMSGGHFFDIFWTFFQRQPQHQDTFQTLFGHFSGRLPGSPKRHFGTFFGHFSAISRFAFFYGLKSDARFIMTTMRKRELSGIG